MKTVDYKKRLFRRLQNGDYAAEYLASVLAHESVDAFLIALRDVIAARGETAVAVAERAGITRQALHKALAATGNPRLSTLTEVLRAIGLQLSVKHAKA